MIIVKDNTFDKVVRYPRVISIAKISNGKLVTGNELCDINNFPSNVTNRNCVLFYCLYFLLLDFIRLYYIGLEDCSDLMLLKLL
jgi:hypothetical protein